MVLYVIQMSDWRHWLTIENTKERRYQSRVPSTEGLERPMVSALEGILSFHLSIFKMIWSLNSSRSNLIICCYTFMSYRFISFKNYVIVSYIKTCIVINVKYIIYKCYPTTVIKKSIDSHEFCTLWPYLTTNVCLAKHKITKFFYEKTCWTQRVVVRVFCIIMESRDGGSPRKSGSIGIFRLMFWLGTRYGYIEYDANVENMYSFFNTRCFHICVGKTFCKMSMLT